MFLLSFIFFLLLSNNPFPVKIFRLNTNSFFSSPSQSPSPSTKSTAYNLPFTQLHTYIPLVFFHFCRHTTSLSSSFTIHNVPTCHMLLAPFVPSFAFLFSLAIVNYDLFAVGFVYSVLIISVCINKLFLFAGASEIATAEPSYWQCQIVITIPS